MPVSLIQSIQARVLTQKTLASFCEQGRWLNSLVQDFRTPVAERCTPAVLLYGSAVSGTAFDNGDADYAVLFVDSTADAETAEQHCKPIARLDQEQVLSSLYNHMKQKCTSDGVALKSQRIFRARIPIVKCVTTYDATPRQFDISLSADGVKNSLLLREYMKADARLRLGALCVKEWGKSEQILNARHGWISPYALTIMYIFYAQKCGLTALTCDETAIHIEPLLESSKSALANGTGPHIRSLDWQDVDANTIMDDVKGFFRFFGCGGFDFDSDVVDIRAHGAIHSKDDWQAQLHGGKTVDETELWHLLGHGVLMLRDPFESHNLGRSVDFFKAESIRERLRLASEAQHPLRCLENDGR